jgi:hypothetical protein
MHVSLLVISSPRMICYYYYYLLRAQQLALFQESRKFLNKMLEHNANSLPDQELIALDGETRLNLYLQSEKRDLETWKIDRLTGDASTRQYFRVHIETGTLVAAVYQEQFDPAEQPFCNITELFAASGLPVPKVIASSGRYAVILLEDLGAYRLIANRSRSSSLSRPLPSALSIPTRSPHASPSMKQN